MTRSTGATAVLAKIPARVPATASFTARVVAIGGGACGMGAADILLLLIVAAISIVLVPSKHGCV